MRNIASMAVGMIPRWWSVAVALAFLVPSWAAGGAESPQSEQVFKAAAFAFTDGQWERAEREFAQFAARYSDSARVAEAVLRQAECRYRLERYEAALELLGQRLPQAGSLADQYQFWIAESRLARGQLKPAAEAYRSLLEQFPASPLRLEAAFGQAFALFRLEDTAAVVALLQNPEGAFQKAAKDRVGHPLTVRGRMLLAESLHRQKEHAAAARVLGELGGEKLPAELDWERQYLLALVELAAQRPEVALERTTNLFNLATGAGNVLLQGRSLKLQAEIQEKREPEVAILTYERLAALDGLPPGQAREAVLKAVDLTVSQNRLTNAIQRLDTHLAGISTNAIPDPSAALVRLTLGELHLKRYYQLARAGTNGVADPTAATNTLQQALVNFDQLINTQTNSPLVGKALLNRGWCLWEESAITPGRARLAESLVAFQGAAERLPKSIDQAMARFKWADCQFRQGSYTNALGNYRTVLADYEDSPDVKQLLFDQALYQVVLASIEIGDLAGAQTAVRRIVAEFKESPVTDRSLILLGRALLEENRLVEARAAFSDFLQRFPNSPLRPEAELDLARCYVREANLPEAIGQYDRWLATYTNHPARDQTEFDRAWAHSQAGSETNALVLFTNLVANFPASRLAPLAQFWVGEYYFSRGDYREAEVNYQSKVLVQNTNAPSPLLGYEARLMAARSAFKRQGYPDALRYITNLLAEAATDTNFPTTLLPQAYFLFGEIRLDEPASASATPFERFTNAISLFRRITQFYPTNHLAPMAQGYIGNCYLQLSAVDPQSLNLASNAYSEVIRSDLADVTARSIAEVGLASAIEKQAEDGTRTPVQQQQLIRLALDHYLSVLYGSRVRVDKGEQPDVYWMRRAGVSAARLAERYGLRLEAIRLYERLLATLPSNGEAWTNRLEALRREIQGRPMK